MATRRRARRPWLRSPRPGAPSSGFPNSRSAGNRHD
jgi:hypothetical protein